LFAPALLLLCAMNGWTAGATSYDDGEELSAHQACAEIRNAIRRLAEAERAQALALTLSARGGSIARVELQLHELLARTRDLRGALRRARLSRAARDPHLKEYVEECVKLGFAQLPAAEQLSSEVQELLMEWRGVPRTPSSSAITPPAVGTRGKSAPAAPAREE
jgi:hypothetical protein